MNSAESNPELEKPWRNPIKKMTNRAQSRTLDSLRNEEDSKKNKLVDGDDVSRKKLEKFDELRMRKDAHDRRKEANWS